LWFFAISNIIIVCRNLPYFKRDCDRLTGIISPSSNFRVETCPTSKGIAINRKYPFSTHFSIAVETCPTSKGIAIFSMG